MQKTNQRIRRAGYSLIILTIMALLSGCGNVLAGTSVVISQDDMSAAGTGGVEWFDGQNIRQATVTLSKTVEQDKIPVYFDKTLIPCDDTQQLKGFTITSNDDITGLYDMQALAEDHTSLIHVGAIYDGAIYHLKDDWYGVVLPNGFNSAFCIRVGNTYFEVQ